QSRRPRTISPAADRGRRVSTRLDRAKTPARPTRVAPAFVAGAAATAWRRARHRGEAAGAAGGVRSRVDRDPPVNFLAAAGLAVDQAPRPLGPARPPPRG